MKTIFDSVDRGAICGRLLSQRVPKKLAGVMRSLYTETLSAIRIDGVISEWFRADSGVGWHQIYSCVQWRGSRRKPWIKGRTFYWSGLWRRLGSPRNPCPVLGDNGPGCALIRTSDQLVQTTADQGPTSDYVQLAGNQVEVFHGFSFIGSHIEAYGWCTTDLRMHE